MFKFFVTAKFREFPSFNNNLVQVVKSDETLEQFDKN